MMDEELFAKYFSSLIRGRIQNERNFTLDKYAEGADKMLALHRQRYPGGEPLARSPSFVVQCSLYKSNSLKFVRFYFRSGNDMPYDLVVVEDESEATIFDHPQDAWRMSGAFRAIMVDKGLEDFSFYVTRRSV